MIYKGIEVPRTIYNAALDLKHQDYPNKNKEDLKPNIRDIKMLLDVRKNENILRQREYNARRHSVDIGAEPIVGVYGEERYQYKYKTFLSKPDRKEIKEYTKGLKSDVKSGLGLFTFNDDAGMYQPKTGVEKLVLKQFEREYNKEYEKYSSTIEDFRDKALSYITGETFEKRERFRAEKKEINISKFKDKQIQDKAIKRLEEGKIGLSPSERLREYKGFYIMAMKSAYAQRTGIDENSIPPDSSFGRIISEYENMSLNDFALMDGLNIFEDINNWYLLIDDNEIEGKLSRQLSFYKDIKNNVKIPEVISDKSNIEQARKNMKMIRSV